MIPGVFPIGVLAIGQITTVSGLITFPMDTGVFTLTGEAATFRAALAATPTTYALNGQACAFTTTDGLGAGTFTLTGEAAVLAPALKPPVGAYGTTGYSATFTTAAALAFGPYSLGWFLTLTTTMESWTASPEPAPAWAGVVEPSPVWSSVPQEVELWSTTVEYDETWTPAPTATPWN